MNRNGFFYGQILAGKNVGKVFGSVYELLEAFGKLLETFGSFWEKAAGKLWKAFGKLAGSFRDFQRLLGASGKSVA